VYAVVEEDEEVVPFVGVAWTVTVIPGAGVNCAIAALVAVAFAEASAVPPVGAACGPPGRKTNTMYEPSSAVRTTVVMMALMMRPRLTPNICFPRSSSFGL
jgi:hypothetical protein